MREFFLCGFFILSVGCGSTLLANNPWVPPTILDTIPAKRARTKAEKKKDVRPARTAQRPSIKSVPKAKARPKPRVVVKTPKIKGPKIVKPKIKARL